MSIMSQSSITDAPETRQDLVSLTLRAVIVAVLLTIAIYLGITRLGFIRINWVPYVVPPVPALLFLLILHALNALVSRHALARRLPRFLQPLSRGEMLMIYAGMCVALAVERGGYIMHYLLSAQYFSTDINNWQSFFDAYPDYYVPKDPRIIMQWFESSPSGRIPWEAWLPFLVWWGTFSLLMVVAMMSIAAFFRRQWVDNERLTFPLLFLPVEMTGGLKSQFLTRAFFKNPLMWTGFGIALLFNGWNILCAFVPALPNIRMSIPIDDGLIEPPWRYLRPLHISMALEVWGLAYLVSGEVLLSTWVFYFLAKAVKLVGLGAGYRAAGFPFYQEMSAGACIAVVVFLILVARPHLARVGRSIIEGPGAYDTNEALPYRWMFLALGGATAGMIGMLAHAGQPVGLLILFFASLYSFVLVATRIRAEVGPPVLWNHPYGFDTTMITHFLGSRNILRMAGPQGMTLFYALFYIGRTVFAHSTAQYFADGLKLGDYGQVRRSSMVSIMLIIAVVGLALTFWYHLDVGYKFGQGLIGAKVGRAGQGWAMNWSKGNYNLLRIAFDNPSMPDLTRMPFYFAGFLFTSVITILRSRLTNFPFHPLGFVMATLYGDHSPYWFPFLVAWLAQRLALRYGGLPLYRRIVPVFLGLTLGHALIGGVLWRIIINYFLDPVVASRYYLNLGG